MDPDTHTHTDPLESLFRPAEKPRFADLKWRPWDEGVFNSTNQELKDRQELAFFAGTVHVRRAVSLNRPDGLSKLVDRTMLNFLASWGISGFFVGREELLRLIEGHETLLDSFRAGVLFAIGKLRDITVAEGVDETEFKELVDAFEAFVHKQYFDTVQLRDGIEEAAALEDVLNMLDAMENVGEVEEMTEKDKAEAKAKVETELDQDGAGDVQEEGGIEGNHEDQKDHKHFVDAVNAEDTEKMEDANKDVILGHNEDSNTDEPVVLLLELNKEKNNDHGQSKSEAVSGGGSSNEQAGNIGVTSKEEEIKKNTKGEYEHATISDNENKLKDQTDGEHTSPKQRSKRAKSKKAKKAKKQAKRIEKKVKDAQKVEDALHVEENEKEEVIKEFECDENDGDSEKEEEIDKEAGVENVEDAKKEQDNIENVQDDEDAEDGANVDTHDVQGI